MFHLTSFFFSFNFIFLLGNYLAWHSKQLGVLLSSQLEWLLFKKKKLCWQLWNTFLIIMLVCACSSFYFKNTSKNWASKMTKIPLSCLDCCRHMGSITWLAYLFCSCLQVWGLCACVFSWHQMLITVQFNQLIAHIFSSSSKGDPSCSF